MIPIPPYIPAWSPVPVVTPFTYRDGVTMLKKVDGIIRYLNRTIVPYINETNQELANKVEADINNMITVVNTAIANLESETDTKLAAMQQTVNNTIVYVNNKIAELTTYIDTNVADLHAYVDEQVQLIINDGIQVQDPVVAGIFNNPLSQSRGVSDSVYNLRGDIRLSITDFAGATPADIGAALDQALAVAAATNRVVTLSKGIWISSSDTKHVLKSYTGIEGDPSGGTILKFTNAAGGLSVIDTMGSGGNHVYEVKLRHLTIDAGNVATTPLVGVRVEELDIDSVRFINWPDTAIEFTDASLVTTHRLILGGAVGNETHVGVRLKGSTGSIEFSSPNFYACKPIVSEGNVSDLRLTGLPWIERCPALITILGGTSTVSIGQMVLTGRFISTLTTAKLFNVESAENIFIDTVSANRMNVQAASSTTPLIDTSASTITGLFEIFDSRIGLNAGAGQLIQVKPDQPWFNAHFRVQNLKSASAGVPYASDKIFGPAFANGGVWAKPRDLDGSGTPEGTITAPSGSTYRDIVNGEMYRKTGSATLTNTGWAPITSGVLGKVSSSGTLNVRFPVIVVTAQGVTSALPAADATNNGRLVHVKYANAAGTTTITGATTGDVVLNPQGAAAFASDGTVWYTLGL